MTGCCDAVSPKDLLRVPCDLDLSEASDREEAEHLYTEQATADTAWNDRSVAMGAFAGQHVRLRFRVQNAGTGATACCFSSWSQPSDRRLEWQS